MAKKLFKEIAEIVCVATGIACAGEFKASIPVWRCFKFLAWFPVGAEFVVGCPFFRVLEYFICLADIFKLGFCTLLFADVRMVFARKSAVCLLTSSWDASRFIPRMV